MTASVVMIAPAEHRASLNALGEAMGYGPDNWNVALSALGASPATHWGTHIWETADGQFRQLRLTVQAGQTPPGLEAYAAALQSLTFRVEETTLDALSNWNAACAEHSLAPVAD